MDHIWAELDSILKKGEDAVLATIVDKTGSAPRSSGAKMIIRKTGEILGSVGGGKLESEAMKAATESFNTRVSRLLPFNLTGKDAAETEMICGGEGEIFLDFIDAGNAMTVDVFLNLSVCVDEGQKCWLVTVIDRKGPVQRCLIKKDKTMIGRFDGTTELTEKLLSGPSKFSIHSEAIDDRRIFVEPIRETGRVFIFGAGHVGKCIAPIAESVGFRTTVVDDRRDFADPSRFPGSTLVVPDSFEKPLPELGFDENSYLVIVTRGHLHDTRILEQVIEKPVAYIGMIGSRHKRDLVYKYLSDERGVGAERIAFVHSPIGIAIPAETPEEIAISVVAELITVRAEAERGKE